MLSSGLFVRFLFPQTFFLCFSRFFLTLLPQILTISLLYAFICSHHMAHGYCLILSDNKAPQICLNFKQYFCKGQKCHDLRTGENIISSNRRQSPQVFFTTSLIQSSGNYQSYRITAPIFLFTSTRARSF